MHIAVNTAHQFRSEFEACGRISNFSYEGLGLLYEYLEEIDPTYQLDVVGLCCEYNEDGFKDIADAYSVDIDGMTEEQIIHTVMEYLQDNTCVVGSTASSIIYAQF